MVPQLCQACDPYLQQVQQGSADDPQVSSLQGLGVVHSRELKQDTVDTIVLPKNEATTNVQVINDGIITTL